MPNGIEGQRARFWGAVVFLSKKMQVGLFSSSIKTALVQLIIEKRKNGILVEKSIFFNEYETNQNLTSRILGNCFKLHRI
jgi:hypothetical protein